MRVGGYGGFDPQALSLIAAELAGMGSGGLIMNPALTETEQRVSHRPLRILLVDDDEPDRLAVRRCLRQTGIPISIDEAATGAEALQKIPGGGYDCVLLDWHLPDAARDFSMCDRIHQIDINMPVVIFTGRGDEEIAVELMKAGAVDYLPKASLSPERLAASLRHALQLSRVTAERRRALEELRVQGETFRTLANAIPQLAWISDRDGNCSWYNERWYEFSGLSFLEQLRDRGWEQLLHPEHLDRVRRSQREAFARNGVWEESFPLRRHDGAWRWFLVRAVPMSGLLGDAVQWLGTNTDITEHKQAEAEREQLLVAEREARVAAERAVTVRDHVLGVVAHDLRNPVHTIGMSAALLLESLSEEKQRRQVAIIQRSANQTERLIRDLLDLATLESGRFTVLQEPVSVLELLGEIIELFETEARSRGITVSSDVSADVPALLSDRARLVQVISNLVGNSLKFTSQGGRVVICARAVGAAIEFSVEDDGPGIAPEELPHIFDPFWKSDRKSGIGTGLGLAICKGIVEAHGGRIWADSVVGRGTKVFFTVPTAARQE